MLCWQLHKEILMHQVVKKTKTLIFIANSSIENTVVSHQNHTEDSKPQFLQRLRTKAGAVWKQGEAEEGSVSVRNRRGA